MNIKVSMYTVASDIWLPEFVQQNHLQDRVTDSNSISDVTSTKI